MTFYQIAFLFFTYSFLGWVGEVVFTAAVRRKYQDRGVLSGPLCILYGIGGLVTDVRQGFNYDQEQVEDILKNLKRTSREVKALMERLRERPWELIRPPSGR